ncbi:hypothetical protein V3471_00585, partial [Flavobacterium oreochromis]|uniref:hypothetical protein n=1 Tax=Flavobacterium oreochromis TaxID=2906078 RepID=UPI00385FCD07
MTAEEKAIGLQILEKQPDVKAVFLTSEGEYFTNRDWAMNGTREKDKIEVIKRPKKSGEKPPKEIESLNGEGILQNNTGENNQQEGINLTENTGEKPSKEIESLNGEGILQNNTGENNQQEGIN